MLRSDCEQNFVGDRAGLSTGEPTEYTCWLSPASWSLLWLWTKSPLHAGLFWTSLTLRDATNTSHARGSFTKDIVPGNLYFEVLFLPSGGICRESGMRRPSVRRSMRRTRAAFFYNDGRLLLRGVYVFSAVNSQPKVTITTATTRRGCAAQQK